MWTGCGVWTDDMIGSDGWMWTDGIMGTYSSMWTDGETIVHVEKS